MGYDPMQGGAVPHNLYTGSDRDAQGARDAQNQMLEEQRGNTGVDWNEQNALLNMYRGRIGLKNSLAEQIVGAPGQLKAEEGNIGQTAQAALNSGVRHTRENFNSRGLLYSGLREGGEQQVKGDVASEYASGIAGAERGSKNSTEAAKAAYAAVGLASEQHSLDMANHAFDTANANNIARLQAMQQLGQGVGSAAGTVAGSYYGPNTPPPPGQTIQDSSNIYSPTTTRGLLGEDNQRYTG